MKKTLQLSRLLCTLLCATFCTMSLTSLFSTNLLAQTESFPGMPADIKSSLQEIGAVIDGANTTTLYAPLFGSEFYAYKNLSRNIAYGPHERNVLDVMTSASSAQPTTNGRPVVIFIHGGGFRFGEKSSPTSPFYDNIMNWAVDEGMVGLSINYRLAPEFQWPSGVEDLTQVVSWVQNNIADYGGDPEQIFLWGHSAGAAHVGDYLAWQANRNLDDGVAGAILTSGFYVLGPEVSMWSAYYGEDLTTYDERSSLSGLLKSSTPLLVNDAELDPDNFKADSIALTEAFAAANKPLTRVSLTGHSHISETYAIGTEDQSLSGPVKAFIQNIIQAQ